MYFPDSHQSRLHRMRLMLWIWRKDQNDQDHQDPHWRRWWRIFEDQDRRALRSLDQLHDRSRSLKISLVKGIVFQACFWHVFQVHQIKGKVCELSNRKPDSQKIWQLYDPHQLQITPIGVCNRHTKVTGEVPCASPLWLSTVQGRSLSVLMPFPGVQRGPLSNVF